jgi:hypothetical protein
MNKVMSDYSSDEVQSVVEYYIYACSQNGELVTEKQAKEELFSDDFYETTLEWLQMEHDFSNSINK